MVSILLKVAAHDEIIDYISQTPNQVEEYKKTSCCKACLSCTFKHFQYLKEVKSKSCAT